MGGSILFSVYPREVLLALSFWYALRIVPLASFAAQYPRSFTGHGPMTVTCILCAFDGARPLFQSKDRVHGLPGVFTLFGCNLCAAVFIHPWLTDEELASYYPEDYGRYRPSRSLDRKRYAGLRRFVLENYYGYPSRNSETPSRAKKTIAFFFSFVMAREAIPYRGDGRFLDVGCGGGSYLYRLRQWGWDVYGVEPSQAGTAQARSLGLNVYHGRLKEAGFQDAFFDVVRLHHVLEHLTDGVGTMREIRRILKPEGKVYITVPNTRSLNFWLFGENWYGLDTPRHVVSYCPAALRFLCRSTEFRAVKIYYQSGAFNFVRSVKYLLEQKGGHWPKWMHRIDWPRNRLIRRTLKPFFLLVDQLRLGDVMVAILQRDSSWDIKGIRTSRDS